MWLEFFKECMVSLIFLGINLLLSKTFFLSQLKLRSVSQQSVFSVESGLILWDLSIHRSFSLVPSKRDKFIFILISSSRISATCVCCKLWLLVILLKILLIMLSWFPFSSYLDVFISFCRKSGRFFFRLFDPPSDFFRPLHCSVVDSTNNSSTSLLVVFHPF